MRSLRYIIAIAAAAIVIPGVVSVASEAPLEINPVEFGLLTPSNLDNSITINAAFSPDDRTVYFSKGHPAWVGLTIFESHRTGPHGWSEPAVAPFSGVYKDTDPVVNRDGRAVIFTSMPDAQGKQSSVYSLFQVSLQSSAEVATPLGLAVNDGVSNSLYPSLTSSGTLYYLRDAGNVTRTARARLEARSYLRSEIVNIQGENDSVVDSDPTVAPDDYRRHSAVDTKLKDAAQAGTSLERALAQTHYVKPPPTNSERSTIDTDQVR